MYFPSNINCANVFVLVVSKVPSSLIELLVMVLNGSISDNPVIEVDVSVRMYCEWFFSRMSILQESDSKLVCSWLFTFLTCWLVDIAM